jgi:TorA maturation chaperone TorD
VPEASLFLDKSGLMYGAPRHEVFGVYAASSLRIKSDAGTPESHLSFELEFLAKMSAEISDHLKSERYDEALKTIELSQGFIRNHIQTWLPQMSELAMKMLSTRFYRGVLKITAAYLDLDLETLEDIKAEICAK